MEITHLLKGIMGRCIVLFSAILLTGLALGLMSETSLAQGGGEDYRVPEVEQQFDNLQLHGDPLAFHLGVGDDPYDWTTVGYCKHYQGMARGEDVDGTPYFFITRSGVSTGGCLGASNNPGELLIVRMGSRDKDGERLRSNRLEHDKNMAETLPPLGTPPLFLDRDWGIKSVHFDGVFTDSAGQVWPRYMHPGDVQLIDDVLIVSLEEYCPEPFGPADDPEDEPGGAKCGADYEKQGAIALIDVQAPEDPQLIMYQDFFAGTDHGLGVIASTYVAADEHPTHGDRYLFAFSWGDSSNLNFAWSDTNDLRTTTVLSWEPLLQWNKGNLGSDEDKWRRWQMLNFVRDMDGSLYLIGAANTTSTPGMGEDWIGLFRVDISKLNISELGDAITYVNQKHLKLDDPGMGHMSAATAAYVSPTGQLIVYTNDHDRQKIDGVKFGEMGEFRNINVNHPATVDAATCSGWVELYEDKTGWDDSTPNRSLIFDLRDRHLDNWGDLDLYDDGFGNAAQSMRWNLPPGHQITLWTLPNYAGGTLPLTEDGFVANLDEPFTLPSGAYITSDWGDLIESVSMALDPVAYPGGPYSGYEGSTIPLDKANPCYLNGGDVTIEWNVDSGLCTLSDPNAPRPTLTCSDSGTYNVDLSITGITYPGFANETTEVIVGNVPPTATFNAPANVDEGSLFTLSLTNPSDPSAADTTAGFEYNFNCGSSMLGWIPITSKSCNTARDEGDLSVKGKIRDKDGGVTVYTDVVTINNVPPIVSNLSKSGIEDTDLPFTSGDFGTKFSDAGPDDTLEMVKIISLPGSGTLKLAGTTVTGNQEILYNNLSNLTFTPPTNWTGTTSFTWNGSDGADYAAANATVTISFDPVNGVNDPPVNSVPGPQTMEEDTSTGLAFSIADVDAGSATDFQVNLSAEHGNLGLPVCVIPPYTLCSDLTISSIYSPAITIQGPLSKINIALWGVLYETFPNYNGLDTITLTANDNGNTGTGGAKTDTDTVDITINAVNDPPTNTVPSAFSMDEDTEYTGLTFSVEDVDAGSATNIEFNLSASHGVLSLVNTTDLTLISGNNGTQAMVYRGNVSAINAALNGVGYFANPDYAGADTIILKTIDNGNTGLGGTRSDEDTVGVTINPINDAPINIMPDPQTTNKNTPLSLSFYIADEDAGSANDFQFVIEAEHGCLSLQTTPDLNLSLPAGGCESHVAGEGTLQAINIALSDVTYVPDLDYYGLDTITLTSSDNGNTGGNIMSDQDTVVVTIDDVSNIYLPVIMKDS
jgi:hypothetical protein